MKKSSLAVLVIILLLCVVGLLTGKWTTLFWLILSAGIFATLFYFINRGTERKETDSAYKRAVKQSKAIREAKSKPVKKKKKSSFKVIDGGKK
ncbi:hypothetical protein HB912_05435 [Listeria aquatica]|uniref:Uncharacterized protein n=2 Tax=Listeria aquatica TaxID=1494960 RepID=A0A841ZLG8_9LIST|nr:hypothetical protein [Listeria aquatica]